MKRIINAILIFALCISTLSLFSCSTASGGRNSRVFSGYFKTEGVLYDYKTLSAKDFKKLADDVDKEFEAYHKLYDIYNEYDGMTNLATINKNAGLGPIKADQRIIDMLSFSKDLYSLTDGNMNIAMGSVLSIWHDHREKGKKYEKDGTPELATVPTEEELREAAKHTNIEDLIIDKEAGTVELRDPEMSLDVGAIGKGYAVEMIAKMIEERHGGGFVIDFGGNLRAIGSKPDGSGWLTGVRNPDKSSLERVVYKTEMKNAAIVTSGGYENSYTAMGVSYHHIINPETLFPVNYHASVSVMTKSSALSDVLSTALFNMRFEEIERFVSEKDGIFVVVVGTNGEVVTLGEKPF
jgi:thiamine biosynthesis lipoprotein